MTSQRISAETDSITAIAMNSQTKMVPHKLHPLLTPEEPAKTVPECGLLDMYDPFLHICATRLCLGARTSY